MRKRGKIYNNFFETKKKKIIVTGIRVMGDGQHSQQKQLQAIFQAVSVRRKTEQLERAPTRPATAAAAAG